MRLLIWLGLGLMAPAAMAQLSVDIHAVSEDGVGDKLGTVTITDSDKGVLLTPELAGLSPGPHGFHLHEHGSCEPSEADGKITPAGAAGGHYDPEETGTHAGPYGDGHLGDLPVLYVKADGSANDPVLAPRLELADLQGRALMIHAGGDTYSDEPELGGGGGRIACGVVPGA